MQLKLMETVTLTVGLLFLAADKSSFSFASSIPTTLLSPDGNPQLILSSSGASTTFVPTTLPVIEDNSTAAFIFNSLNGLLKQWDNSIHSNGHTIIPGWISPYTLLYHARKDSKSPPPNPEWFAFDEEMSFAIMAGRGGQTFLHTYRSTRPLRILYFDGESASLGGTGWQDSQETFLLTQDGGNKRQDVVWWDDYSRARRLCEWSKNNTGSLIDGFVRMNSGFEVMWCDFTSSSIELVSHLNITAPETESVKLSVLPVGVRPALNKFDDPPRPPGGPPGGRRPGFPQPPRSPYVRSSAYEWMRTTAKRFWNPQTFITLDYSSFITFYNPRLKSLNFDGRNKLKMAATRVWTNITAEDAKLVEDEVKEVIERSFRHGGASLSTWDRGSGVDWNSVSTFIVDHWADRVAQLADAVNSTLSAYSTNLSTPLNTTVEVVRLLSYSAMNSFMDTSTFAPSPNLSISAINSGKSKSNWFTDMILRCEGTHTSFIPPSSLTEQEVLLKSSVEFVMRKLCGVFGVLFTEAANETMEEEKQLDSLNKWHDLLQELMLVLDWPTWVRCTEVCDLDSFCAISMWPIFQGPENGGRGRRDTFPGRDGDNAEPQVPIPSCVKYSDYIKNSRWGGGGHDGGDLIE